MAGKPEAFSDEENAVLRDAFRRLRKERELSQAEAGELVGIAQQNAGRLLSATSRAGMSRTTANRLARALGFRDAEELLLDANILPSGMREPPTGRSWQDRDIAMRIARSVMHYDEPVIQAVLGRFTAPEYQHKSMRWWNDRIVTEHLARAAEADDVSVSAPETAAAPRAKRKKRGAA